MVIIMNNTSQCKVIEAHYYANLIISRFIIELWESIVVQKIIKQNFRSRKIFAGIMNLLINKSV